MASLAPSPATPPSSPPAAALKVLAIGGPTRGGKSTLANALADALRVEGVHVETVHADRYWRDEKPFVAELGFPNWECPEAVDEGKVLQAVQAAVKSCLEKANNKPAIVLVEGFLLYALPSPALEALYTHRVFLAVHQETCWQRRMTTKPVPLTYFNSLLWPSFLRYNRPLLTRNDVIVLNGEESTAALVQKTLLLLGDSIVASDRALLGAVLQESVVFTESDLVQLLEREGAARRQQAAGSGATQPQATADSAGCVIM